LAVRTIERILQEARDAWPSARLGLHHRIGRLEPGDASVVIAAASPHRADAFAATRYAIERVKQIVPIWKREHFDGGEVWLEGATADPEDAGARDKAYRIACA
jgi:molybdopterin synthase catalytic subunit